MAQFTHAKCDVHLMMSRNDLMATLHRSRELAWGSKGYDFVSYSEGAVA